MRQARCSPHVSAIFASLRPRAGRERLRAHLRAISGSSDHHGRRLRHDRRRPRARQTGRHHRRQDRDVRRSRRGQPARHSGRADHAQARSRRPSGRLGRLFKPIHARHVRITDMTFDGTGNPDGFGTSIWDGQDITYARNEITGYGAWAQGVLVKQKVDGRPHRRQPHPPHGRRRSLRPRHLLRVGDRHGDRGQHDQRHPGTATASSCSATATTRASSATRSPATR